MDREDENTTREHPRTCGEHHCDHIIEEPSEGTPPHLRGTLCPRRSRRPHRREHPRTCGEHYKVLDPTDGKNGTPPHLRGTQIRRLHACGRLRNTPAPAGNTYLLDRMSIEEVEHPRTCGEHPPPTVGRLSAREHPRTCGEHSRKCATRRARVGTPPHLRGTR